MNSHNLRAEPAFHKTPAVKNEASGKVNVTVASPTIQTELSLDDDFDLGTDPYNATGQHVVIKTSSTTK